MKKYCFLLVLSFSILLLVSSCSKSIQVAAPDDFMVTTDNLTYKVGDSIIFNFNSGPDEISFYSGEPGKVYDNNSRLSMAGINKLVFQSNMTGGVLAGNTDSMRLLISTNLAGYDSASLVNATWTDITSRNSKWPTALSTTFITSDSIDISDFNVTDSINLAFRFKGKSYPTAAQRKWQVQNLTLSNKLADGTLTPLFASPYAGVAITASSFQYTGWIQANLLPNYLDSAYDSWNVGTGGISIIDSLKNSYGTKITSAYPLTFDPSSRLNNNPNDAWAVTTKTSLKKVYPDVGVTIKNYLNSPLYAGMSFIYNKIPGVYARFLYKYNTPGVYNITFVATNLNLDKTSSVIRKLQITVTP